MKSTLKGLKRIFELAEERISKPEDRVMKITKSEEPKKPKNTGKRKCPSVDEW